MNMKHLLIIAMLATASLSAKIPPQVKKSVAFIFTKDSTNHLSPVGTGFFVLMKANSNTDTVNFGYLVTAKNVLLNSSGMFFDTVYIRLNRKDGYSDTLNIPLTQNGIRRFFLHPDSSINLAVIPAYPDLNRYDFLFLPAGMIAPIDFFKQENLAEGDELFHIGMYEDHIGMFKNIPVVRFGKIAQLSEEKYAWGNGFTELYLVETQITKGSAGSPLYYYTAAVKDSGGSSVPAKLFLAGIISGNYGGSHSQTEYNDLIAVVPAFSLNELFNSPTVMKERENELARIKNQKAK